MKVGDTINTFRGANDAIGTLVLRFDTEKEVNNAMISINDWCKVEIECY